MKPQQAKLSSGVEKKNQNRYCLGGKENGDWQERDSRKFWGGSNILCLLF